MKTKREEIKKALLELGYSVKDAEHNFIKELDNNRARVFIHKKRIGIYDFDKHTFID